VVFPPAEDRRYVGCGWPGGTHKEQPEQPNPLVRRSEPEPNRLGGGGSSPRVSRAPEGGGPPSAAIPHRDR
jgi:hypothetical protein